MAYTWDSRNRLVGLSSGSSSFKYDAFGRRTRKTVGGTSTEFLYDGQTAVQELHGSTVFANLLNGFGVDEYLVRTEGANTRSFITDALGSTLALADSAGTLQTEYAYDPFGNGASTGIADGNAFGYTGRETDGTGLMYYRARYYNPTLQRFASQDPIGFAGGLNSYAFVWNDPVNWIDPDGQAAEHKTNKTESNRNKHEKANARRNQDRGGEKGDKNRSAPRARPDNHRGPWPKLPRVPGLPMLICPLCAALLPEPPPSC